MSSLDLILIFSIGTVVGWFLELLYRTLFSQKKLVNPGFLSGPYLPIYGFGFLFLYLLSLPQMPLTYRFVLFFLGTTILEWITGEFFLRFYSLRLWDYTKNKFNYKGLICPKFSLYWTMLSIMFYYLIFPKLVIITELTRDNIYFYLGIGFYMGIFIEDVIISFHLATRLKNIIRDVVENERLKLHLKLKELTLEQKVLDFKFFKHNLRANAKSIRRDNFITRYFNPFMSSKHSDLKASIANYFNKDIN